MPSIKRPIRSEKRVPMLITPDLSQAVESSESDSVAPGVYNVRVEKAELKDTQKGEKRINWTLRIFGAEGEYARFNNWTVFYSTMIQGKGVGMLKSFYKACTGTELSGEFDATSLFGKELQVTVVAKLNADGSPSKYPDVKGIKPLAH